MCIRDRIFLHRIDYPASDGQEIFLQFTNKQNRLYALLRLRINNNNTNLAIPTLKNASLIREVHTYGKLASIGKKEKNSPQHIGLGKKLLKEAERITKEEFGLNKIAVISGIGVRDYYRQNGYRLQNTYMVKKLN